MAPLTTWLQRRRDFAQEWAFHRQRALIELADLGLNESEAGDIVRLRFGWRSQYRKSAMRGQEADLRGLWSLLKETPWLQASVRVPVALALLIAMVFAINPYRHQVWGSVWRDNVSEELFRIRPRWWVAPPVLACAPAEPFALQECQIQTGWVKPVHIPAGSGKLLWFVFVVAGVWRLTKFWRDYPKRWGYWVYGITTLKLVEILFVSLWVSAMQLFEILPWYSSDLRTICYVIAGFVMLFASYLAFRAWQLDLECRCPACLRPLGLPLERGLFTSFLLNPPERELICVEGHGTVKSSRWDREFQESPGFWADLEKTPSV